MHVPDSVLSGPVCTVSMVLSLGVVAWAAVLNHRAASPVSPLRFGAVSAFLFASQMLNVPLAFGSSGHFLGGVLAAVLLGIPTGILAMTLVVLVQCLVFSDGGFSALGANVFNLAVVGAGVGGLMEKGLNRRVAIRPLSAAVAAAGMVVVAATVSAWQLWLSGAGSFLGTLEAVLVPHGAVALFEGVVTGGLVFAFARSPADTEVKGSGDLHWVSMVVLSGLGLALLSPLASEWPDAYESALGTLGALREDAPAFTGVLMDYEWPGLEGGVAAVAAGIAGMVLLGVVAWACQFAAVRRDVGASG
jgi:cobalt/nickel transport system permease protein